MNLDMTKGSPLKLILKFLVPVLLGCVFQQLYNMVDTIIVGKGVGSDALAAVGATGTIVFFILGFMNGLTTGFTVLSSQRYGAGDYEGLRKSVGNAFCAWLDCDCYYDNCELAWHGLAASHNADARGYL